jgi:hypothetical protein
MKTVDNYYCIFNQLSASQVLLLIHMASLDGFSYMIFVEVEFGGPLGGPWGEGGGGFLSGKVGDIQATSFIPNVAFTYWTQDLSLLKGRVWSLVVGWLVDR